MGDTETYRCPTTGHEMSHHGTRGWVMSRHYAERYGGRRWRTLRLAILDRDGRICWLCGNAGADTVDHVTPRFHGGTDDPTNLRAAHGACNYGRRERAPAVASPTRAW